MFPEHILPNWFPNTIGGLRITYNPVNIITEKFLAIQQKASKDVALTTADIVALDTLLGDIWDSSLPSNVKTTIIDQMEMVFRPCTSASQKHGRADALQIVSELLLKNCSDEAISHFLGLDTWQSEGHVEEAKARIIHYVHHNERGHQKLDLNNLGLTSLPEQMFPCLINLEDFSCDRNKLRSLPVTIGNLPHLTKLSVSNNLLSSLPAEVKHLIPLKELILRGNRLTSLPKEIGCLSFLSRLDCSCNDFTELPQILTSFKGGVHLNFSSNQISSCPPEFARLTLDISEQGITVTSVRKELRAFETARQAFARNEMAETEEFNRKMNDDIEKLKREMADLHVAFSRQRQEIAQQSERIIPSRQQAPRRNADSFSKLKEKVSGARQDLKNLEIPNLQADQRTWPTISLFIDKIIGTVDFEKFPAMTAQRLLLILQLAETNEEFRASMNATLMEALSTCVDRASFFLCPLETQKAILEVGSRSLEEMLKVLKGAYASDLFDAWALDFVKGHSNPMVKEEELSVHLALKVEFKKEFCLPIGIDAMNYRFCAHLEPSNYADARVRVTRIMQNQELFVEFLLGQQPWLEKLRKDFPSEREAALQEVNQAFGELEDQRSKLTDQEYTLRSEVLLKKFIADEKLWLKAKTQAIVSNNS